MVSDKVYNLCRGTDTVSSELAKDPSLPPSEAYKKLYGHHDLSVENILQRDHSKPHTVEELKKAEQCGNWGPTKPGELFLKIYHDALCTLDKHVAGAVVSPPLMGSCGVAPLTIMSTVPDIMRHMSNLIVRAEKEVFIATNYWISSVASKFVTDALKELSNRAAKRNVRVVVKLMYDRGSPWQVLNNHQSVSEKDWQAKAVNLPPLSDIPHLDLQVVNYHRPMLGTFHAKFMIVDRKIALVQSNNIQDNSNFEMACHFEGPIVDSLYDMALITWNNKLEPPLPSANMPAAKGGITAFSDPGIEKLFGKHGELQGTNVVIHPQKIVRPQPYGPSTPEGVVHPVAGGGREPLTPKDEEESTVQNPRIAGQPVGNVERGADLATETYLADGKSPLPQAQIEHPSLHNALPEHTADDPHYDDDIAGEVARVQTSVSPHPNESRVEAVTRHLNHTVSVGFKGNAPDCPPTEEYTPYIPHPPHEPFPIALVNRFPFGTPDHSSVITPQNEAWLSGLRNAKKNVFIQTPDLNAQPLIPVIIETCERGVDVFCYVCLGYNDSGELLPMQGGTNEMIANKLYTTIKPEFRKNLHWFWYVGKDMTEPIVAKHPHRTCHIKLMIVDEHVGIQGSGNQDTQSWYHSQEVNVLLESKDLCKAWIDGLRRNQNTHLYGQVSKEDGIWRDKDGNQAKDVIGIDPGSFSWAKGIVGAVKRVQGTGGF